MNTNSKLRPIKAVLIALALAAAGCGGSGGSGGGSSNNPNPGTLPGTYALQGDSITVQSNMSFTGTIVPYTVSGTIQSDGTISGKILTSPNGDPPVGTSITGTATLNGGVLDFNYSYSYSTSTDTYTGSGTLDLPRQ
jgi:hypothetical protein